MVMKIHLSFFKSFMDILLARESTPIQDSRDENVMEYPVRPKGIPVIAPKTLMENHKETIQRIIEQAITGKEINEKFYLPTIERFASYVQLLPASQAHHHHDIGGLFRHSLEVGYRALQLADRVLVGGTRTPRQRRELRPRWQFAVFAAALCHDAGKPLTDLTVTNLDRTLSWKPLDDDLYVWAVKNKLPDYHLDWREGRGREHTSNGSLLLHRIIGGEAIQWLELSGMDLVTWLNESLSYNPSVTNLIHELVIKSDQFSVERNLKAMGSSLVASDTFHAPTELYMIQIMKGLISEGMWRINEPGARVWKIGEQVYIVWPAGGNEMAQHARLDNVPMVPRTAEAILEFLVEREIAVLPDFGNQLWEIVPDCIAERIPGKSLFAIRIKCDSLLMTLPIESVPGKLLNEIKKIFISEVGCEISAVNHHDTKNENESNRMEQTKNESIFDPSDMTDLPTIEDVIAVLRKSNFKQVDIDGWYRLPVVIANREFCGHGLKIYIPNKLHATSPYLKQLAEKNLTILHADKSFIRFKT
jgi:conjugal transfer pilus assembly protein TraI